MLIEEIEYDDIDNLDKPTEEDRGDLIEEESDEDAEDTESDEADTESSELEDEDEDEEVDEEGSPENKIPLSRLNQVIAQRDEQKDRVAWLEAQLDRNSPAQEEIADEAVEAYDFDKAEEDYQNLFLEGETAKAAKLRGEIRKAEREELTLQITAATATATETAKGVMEERDFDDLVESLEVSHPFLDSSSKSYNEEAVSMVNSLMNGYTSDGKTGRSTALKLAVDKLSPMFMEDGEPTTKKQTLGSKTKARKIASRKRAADTSNKQPTKLKGKGGETDLGDVNVDGLSDKAFGQLSLKELKALRGD